VERSAWSFDSDHKFGKTVPRKDKHVAYQITLELSADMAGLEKADKTLDELALALHLPEETLFQVRLVLEEVLMNVISYGAGGGAVPHVQLSMAQEDSTLSMEIADNGIAFDPLQLPAPDLDAEIDDRPIGGLGIFLVRELMDSVTYRRDGDWNRLRVTKTVPT
jgi:anti-sigma regulatory factor (Ser/Thr protein kinase)